MRVVRADQEQTYGHREQELLGRCVLVAVVDLLPHVQVVIGASVELERYTAHVVKHEVAAEHVGDVGHGPGSLLRYRGHDVVENFQQQDDDYVNHPCTLHVDPVGVQVRVGFLVAELLEILGRFMVHQTTTPSAPPPLLVSFIHLSFCRLNAVGRRQVHIFGEGDAAPLEDRGRHFGGVGGVFGRNRGGPFGGRVFAEKQREGGDRRRRRVWLFVSRVRNVPGRRQWVTSRQGRLRKVPGSRQSLSGGIG